MNAVPSNAEGLGAPVLAHGSADSRPPARRDAPPCDPSLLFWILMVSFLGVAMMYSASYAVGIARYHDHLYFVRRQLLSLLIGLGLMGVVSICNLRSFRAFVPWMFAAMIGLLVAVLVVGRGVSRWLPLGPLGSFQPSELAKFVVVFMIAHVLSEFRKNPRPVWMQRTCLAAITLPVFLLVLFEPHLSATALIAATSCVMFFLAGARPRTFIHFALAAILFFLLLFIITRSYSPIRRKFDYMAERVQVHLGLGPDSEDKQYQARQSLSALKRGGLTGVGFCNGRGKLLYVPAPQNDFIFSVIGEEFGLAGSIVVILLLSALALKCWNIAYLSNDHFVSLSCAGIATLVGLQTIINVGVATAVLPTTGVALPLISYGGSGLAVFLAALGFVLNASRSPKMINTE